MLELTISRLLTGQLSRLSSEQLSRQTSSQLSKQSDGICLKQLNIQPDNKTTKERIKQTIANNSVGNEAYDMIEGIIEQDNQMNK